MSKVTKQCRICGKTYTPCGYCEGDQMAFHYRTICCSRECAKVYLTKVLEARGQLKKSTSSSQENTEHKKVEISITKSDQDENANETPEIIPIEEEKTATALTKNRRRAIKKTESETAEQMNK